MTEIGGGPDEVVLYLADEYLLLDQQYTIRQGVLAQPSTFQLTIGHDDVIAELIKAYPPRTPFQLRIGGHLQMTGFTDGFDANDSDGARLVLEGRDQLAEIQDATATSETSWKDVTHYELVQKALANVLVDAPWIITATNEHNRSTMAGVKVRESKAPAIDPLTSLQRKTVQAKLDASWYSGVLGPELERAGLFLWAGAEAGEYILSTPNANQEPTYRIVRRRGANVSNVIAGRYSNRPYGRFSRCEVRCRQGGGKESRSKSVASVIDEEMVALGYNRPRVIKDDDAKSVGEAQFLALRRLAESRRASWSLTYTLSGNTLPAVQGGRAVVTPDTVVEVDDEEFGLRGLFYLENVVRTGGSQSTSVIRLMRPEDVVFASPDLPKATSGTWPGGARVRIGTTVVETVPLPFIQTTQG